MGSFIDNMYGKAQTNSLGRKGIGFASTFLKLNRKYKSKTKAMSDILKNYNELYVTSFKYDKGVQTKSLFSKVQITIPDEGFIFFLDEFKNLAKKGKMIYNISVDYYLILENSVNDLYDLFNKAEIINQDFINNQLGLIEGIEILIHRIVAEIKTSNHNEKSKYIEFFENMLDKKAEHFEEGLQRILFFNQLLWQTSHNLSGLGRLDKILGNLYVQDINNGYISEEEAFSLIKSFLSKLHSYYWFKSEALMGDTGQVIILGGKEENAYFSNDLTYMFIKAIKELQLPDPKLLLRVSKYTPRDLIELSLETINTGIGCPLFSNDDIVIEKMVGFGYDRLDATNYVVSACWEPSALGKGIEQNNIDYISFLNPLNHIFDMKTEEINKITDFNSLILAYKKYLKMEADCLMKELDAIEWNEDPLLSLFIDDCYKKQLDISKGGAKYNHYGITTVSLANTVNSLLNLKKLVFDEKRFTLNEINEIRKSNFSNDDENLLNLLKSGEIHFGIDDDEVLALSNELICYLEDCFSKFENRFGGKLKFGLSAPSYIIAGERVSASFDGRRNGEPFSTHISSDSNKDYTELMRFASKLDYGGCKFNGNVVDLVVSPDFIKDNFDKFTDYIFLSIKLGFFQMQMNVVDSKTLIEAKANPELHPNLIVRVWGFSAYFNDLPLSYKDVLIERALKNEGKLAV